ncbi:hypothetical protein HN51_062556 [Arachis hypogaea]
MLTLLRKGYQMGSINSSTEDNRKPYDSDMERENECGICLVEPCTKIVLPSCLLPCHVNTRSKSCPFCRESLKRIKSRDLWVLT